MNSGACKSVRTCDAEMYAIGYPYGAWVVREDALGLSPVCSLTYFRDRPTPEDLGAIYGERLLRVAAATPDCPVDRGDGPLDGEVLAPAVH